MSLERYVIPSKKERDAPDGFLVTNSGEKIPMKDFKKVEAIMRRAWGLSPKKELDEEQKKAVRDANNELYYLKGAMGK